MEDEKRIAVLIDADNVSFKYIKFILDEIATIGVPTYKRIYGDWTSTQHSNWKAVLLENSVMPVQQYSYTTGKNATDSALIIDAMDILYSNNVDGFCIVSSDSDFTRLAARLRESGMLVIGMGEQKTPKAFVKACERFKYLEALSGEQMEEEEETAAEERTNPKSTEETDREIKNLTRAIRKIITEVSDDDGWAFMGDVGNILAKRFPDFDTRNYGYSKLTKFLSSLKGFVIDSRPTQNPHIQLKYIKIK